MATSCKKQPVDQLSLLPPATQTGANTFGCLVDGAAFVPKNISIVRGPVLRCEYSLTAQGYVFYITSAVDAGNGMANAIDIRTDSLKISEGETLSLTKSFTPGLAAAGYGDQSNYTTNANATGQLNITHLDTLNQIVSGTFHFNAVSKGGDTVKITNGRFDVHYML
ncbi:MAG TPA: DUF6252 family protein [Mucilaginibacter sp.]|nr:DUF6252 family protein [Mucilaginibacter sp.]